MKLYMSINKHPLNGYIHIDPNPLEGCKFVGNLLELTNIAYYETCDEIIVEHLLDMIPFDDRINAIKHWHSLLCNNGTIRIIGNDIIEISKTLLLNDIGTEIFNKIIYERQSIDELSNVVEQLKAAGFNITKQRLHLHQYLVEASK